jgi:hypothetical protein
VTRREGREFSSRRPPVWRGGVDDATLRADDARRD